MDGTNLNMFSFNYKNIVIDEIALEGLEGITIEMLWRRIEYKASLSLNNKLKQRIWEFILGFDGFNLYKLPTPKESFEILNRFTIVDPAVGHLLDPDIYLDGPYEYCPVPDQYGSCEAFLTRKQIKRGSLKKESLETVTEMYGNTLVIVASIDERWHALVPHLPKDTTLPKLSSVHYCLLELIGKARENGQMSVGKTNLTKISKNSKLLFYQKKHIKKLDLLSETVTTETINGKGQRAILIRLKRFQRCKFSDIPAHGEMHNLIMYLKERPNFSETADVLAQKNLLPGPIFKRIKKTPNIFIVEDTIIKSDSIKQAKPGTKTIRTTVKYLVDSEASSDDSEDENADTKPMQCEYYVGIPLLRQAYERFLDAGPNGLALQALCQVLGVEFYTGRRISRLFLNKRIIREITEDTGKQRRVRYIAKAGTTKAEREYAQEKKKLQEFLSIRKRKIEEDKSNSVKEEIPVKRKCQESEDSLEASSSDKGVIEEIKHMEGYEDIESFSDTFSSNKNISLRQIRFANGVLGIIKQRSLVTGFYTLNEMVSKETGEPKFDSKMLKKLMQKLLLEKQIRLYKIIAPTNKAPTTFAICAPEIDISNRLLKDKYKEICMRHYVNNKKEVPKKVDEKRACKSITFYSYPRYMRAKKLHKYMMKVLYFGEEPKRFDQPEGFASLINILSEIPVGLALGHNTVTAMAALAHLRPTEQLLATALKDAPHHIFKLLMESSSLFTSLRSNLMLLAAFGLVQICIPPLTDKCSPWFRYTFYFNRKAKLIDTKGPWPRPAGHPPAPELLFDFRSYDDVRHYWTELQSIALDTVVASRRRDRQPTALPTRCPAAAPLHDQALLFGDGRGPAGFDSSYHLDLPRLWESLATAHTRPLSRVSRRPKQPRRRRAPPRKRAARQPRPRRVVRVEKDVNKKPLKRAPRLRTKRRIPPLVQWSEAEDRVILLTRAALTVMSPATQPGYLTVRNLCAKDLLCLYDPTKTANDAHKRVLTLESRSAFTHERECLINALRRHRHVVAKYEGIVKKLRLANVVNMARYVNAARLRALELVHVLDQIARSPSFKRRVPCAALSLAEFHSRYSITTETGGKPSNPCRPAEECGAALQSLQQAVLVGMAAREAGVDAAGGGAALLALLQRHDETALRAALQHLRKSGLVVVRDKNWNNFLYKFSMKEAMETAPDCKTTMTRYRLSAAFWRRVNNTLLRDGFSDMAGLLAVDLPATTKFNSRIVCLIFELYSMDALDVVTHIPPNVLGYSSAFFDTQQCVDADRHFLIKTGSVGWKKSSNLNKYEDVFQKHDYSKLMNAVLSNITVNLSGPTTKVSGSDGIVKLLEERRENGAMFKELQTKCGVTLEELRILLEKMEKAGVVKNLGLFENIIVLTEHAKKWCVEIDAKLLIPIPCLTLEGTINVKLFLDWTAITISKICDCPGISVKQLVDTFECLTAKFIQIMCLFLKDCSCVKLKTISVCDVDLFSDEYNDVPQLFDYIPYADSESILVFPVKNSLSMFALVKKNVLEHADRKITT